MRVREAKDFLVQQTAEQASLEHLPFTELEKRMMYFTESGEMSEDAIELHNAFEAKYDSSEYERKVARLMAHAYTRLKKQNPQSVRTWDEAIKELQRGDHYILLPWKMRTTVERPRGDTLKLLGTALLVVVVGIVLTAGWLAIADHFGFHWRPRPVTYHSVPLWLQRLFLAILVGLYLNYGLAPFVLKKPPIRVGHLLIRLMGSGKNSSKSEI
jgi:hypothetical protein